MPGRVPGVVVGVAALAAASALALTGPSGAPASAGPSRAELDGLRGEVDARLREAAAGVHARAQTLAELPRLQAAVSTDAATVRDLTQEELMFRTKPGETIEIAQVTNAGGIESLWKTAGTAATPEAANAAAAMPQPPLDKTGYHLVAAGGALYLAEVVDVTPRARADELRGALALAWQIDLAPIAAKAGPLGVAAWIEADGGRVDVTRSAGATGETVPLPLASEPGRGAKLVAQLPPANAASSGGGARKGAAGAVALFGLVVAGLLWRRGTPDTAAPAASAPGAAGSAVTSRGPSTVGAAGRSGTQASQVAGAPGFAATSLDVSGGAALAAAPVSSGEQHVGRYAIVKLLGSGGMADVFLARASGEAGFEKLVALKVLHRDMARKSMIVDHFLDEARLASRLVHPNIVQISDLGRADDAYYIAMEYIEGSDLERLLTATRERKQPVPLRVAFTIVRRILDGLHAAHTAVAADGKPLELVHRDVKAANVFIARNGAVKIGDFGIAKANQESRVARTEIGQVKGTAAYMAPEHRSGESVDARADLYSAGAIAYEVFTGQEINLDLVRLVHRGREGWPHLAPPSSVRADLPPELDAVIFKALAYDKADRFATCEVFEEALGEIAERHGFGASDKVVAQWVAGEIGSDPSLRSAPGTGSTT